MKRSFFITFEGGEGSGKSTQLALLSDYLKALGFSVVCTREPGGTQLGEVIRKLILNAPEADPEIAPKTELFLYLASRAQHISEVIQPALNAGKIILCDRFTDATLAYQGAGRGLPKTELVQMTQIASSNLEPDLTFFLDIKPEAGLARLGGREEINRMDQEALQFHESVYQGYKGIIAENPTRINVIDATDSIETIALIIREKIDALLS